MFPPNISKKELERSQTAIRNDIDNTIPDDLLPNAVRLAWFLQSLRDKIYIEYGEERAVNISSGYRGEKLNDLIGGSITSAHPKALAADINVHGMSPFELAKFVELNMVEEGFDQVIHEFGEWVHVGLTNGHPRSESLTAMRENGKTVYKTGLKEV